MFGTTKKVKTSVTFRVPKWNFCNHQAIGGTGYSEEKCRFCVDAIVEDKVEVEVAKSNRGRMGASSVRQKTVKRKVTVCALYNWPLLLQEGILVKKCEQCCRATAGFPEDRIVDCDNDELYRSRFLGDKEEASPSDTLAMLRKYQASFKRHIRDGLSVKEAETLAELEVLS